MIIEVVQPQAPVGRGSHGRRPNSGSRQWRSTAAPRTSAPGTTTADIDTEQISVRGSTAGRTCTEVWFEPRQNSIWQSGNGPKRMEPCTELVGTALAAESRIKHLNRNPLTLTEWRTHTRTYQFSTVLFFERDSEREGTPRITSMRKLAGANNPLDAVMAVCLFGHGQHTNI